MKTIQNQVLLIAVIALSIALIYKLSPILTPFLLGGLLAYLVDPLVKRLQKCRIPHLLSVVLIFLFLFLSVTVVSAILYPLVFKQLEQLVSRLPAIIEWLQNVGMPWLTQFVNVNSLKAAIPDTLTKSGWVLSTFIHSSIALFDILLSLVLTPIVTFYLLKDWDKVLSGIKNLLPKQSAPTVIAWAKNCDEILGAFIRGQLIVMLFLGMIYGIGLSIIGLNYSWIIGFVGGLLSIVPFLGSLFVLIASLIAATMQVGSTNAITGVLIVFLIAHAIENYLLTPYFIGERIGLHPVAVIFSVMAGGVLFGFFGILLALPVSAILMATFRFFRHQPVSA